MTWDLLSKLRLVVLLWTFHIGAAVARPSRAVAQDHYLQVTDTDFDQAARGQPTLVRKERKVVKEVAQKAAQEAEMARSMMKR